MIHFELYRPIYSEIIPEIVIEVLENQFGKDSHLYPKISSDFKNWKSSDWKNISKVINPYEKWNSTKLIEAFLHSQNIKKGDLNFLNTSKLLKFGEKTNKNPNFIDIIDMYNICVRRDIKKHDNCVSQ